MPSKPKKTTADAVENNEKFSNERMVIPIIEEEVTVQKHIVPTGKVNITKRVRELEEMVDVPTYRGEVNINRVPVNMFVEEHPQIRQEGDTMIIPVVQEQVVMIKKLLLVEELHVENRVIETHHPQKVTLLKEEVEVRRTAENEHLDSLTKGVSNEEVARRSR
jgi:uncharacterized protein (TIGR02271 family)